MAISYLNFQTIKQLLPHISGRPVQIVSVGYPDMMLSVQQVRELFGDGVAAALRFREDSEKILKWHGLVGKLDKIIETEHFFNLLDTHITFLDISKIRGSEIVQDLNTPLQPGLENRFDIVFDGGTLEHCFNVGQAIQNFLSMAKVGGFIYHNNPLNWVNHGFFSFSPTFYHDFYVDNGHRLASDIGAYYGDPLNPSFIKLPPTARHKEPLPESSITVVAQRMHDRPAAWPMQTKYKKSLSLSG